MSPQPALPSSLSEPPKQCTPNILPCRIHHTGALKISKRHWTPKSEADGTQTAYFRGRKLRGRKVSLAKGYEGHFVRAIEKILAPAAPDPTPPNFEEEGEEEEPIEPASTKMLEGNSTFAHLVVWGHDVLPGPDDVFVKGVEEWIAFAERIHSCSGAGAEDADADADTDTARQ